jgi:Protein of unknown function (DUF4232)
VFTRFVSKKPGTTVMALASLGAVLAVAGYTAAGTQGAAAAGAPPSASTSASGAAGTAATPATISSGQSQSTTTAQQDSGGGSGSGADSGSGSGSGSQSAPACLLSGLTVNTGPYLSPAGTGIAAEPIILTNTGPAACTVLGWPGVAALSSSGGTQVYQATRIGPEGSPITLAPGASASAVLYAVVSLGGPGYGGSSSCTQVPNLLVTPPNETHSGQIGFGSPVCVTPALTALHPGAGGGTVSASAEYYEALQLWKKGAAAISAAQGSYEIQANNLLVNALGAGVAGTSGFLKASQELTQLSALPDAMMNPTQEAEFNADATALNAFFGTSGLYN